MNRLSPVSKKSGAVHTSFLEKYFADDYVAIHGDGKLSTKAEEIENFKSGTTKYESIEVREAKIRTYGDTAAELNRWIQALVCVFRDHTTTSAV